MVWMAVLALPAAPAVLEVVGGALEAPILDQALDELADSRIELIKEYSSTYGNVSDEQASKLGKKWIEVLAEREVHELLRSINELLSRPARVGAQRRAAPRTRTTASHTCPAPPPTCLG